MPWPPKPGELLPRAEEPLGVRRKLAEYALDHDHPIGGAKAQGFAEILGITIEDVDYLEREIRIGILNALIGSVRDNPPFGHSCAVDLPLRGLGAHRVRVVNLRTVWEYADPGSSPRLVSAFPKP